MKCHQLVDPRVVHMRRITSLIFCVLLSQFEPVAGDLSSERARSRELTAKIAKRDPLDVQKVLYEARLCLFVLLCFVRNHCVMFTRSLTILVHEF